jgi:hypothetical protein
MKRLTFLSNCVLLLVLTGCQEPSRYSTTPGSLKVIVEDGGKFPEFLVGKWEGNGGWGFIFEPGGNIFVARIAMGRAEIVPGEIKTIPTHMGGEAIYVPGDWLVVYSPSERELAVDMVMNYIRVEMGDKVLQGKTRDIIIGTVSEDGKLWRGTVSSFPEYEGFPTEPNDLPFEQKVILKKIVE